MIVVGHAGHAFGLDREKGRVTWSIDFASLDECGDCAGQAVEIEADNNAGVYAACAGHVFRIAVDDGSIQWHANLRRRGSSETTLAVIRN